VKKNRFTVEHIAASISSYEWLSIEFGYRLKAENVVAAMNHFKYEEFRSGFEDGETNKKIAGEPSNCQIGSGLLQISVL